jgi:hypothetical protein
LVAAFVETGAQSDGLSETNEFDIEISDGRFATFGMAKDVGLNFDLGSEGDEKSCPWRVDAGAELSRRTVPRVSQTRPSR